MAAPAGSLVNSFINSANHLSTTRARKAKILLILSVLLSVFSSHSAKHTIGPKHPVLDRDSLACRDDKGETIDWTLSYKLPRLEEHENPQIADGVASIYLHKYSSDQWTLSKESMLSPKSIIGSTLAQYWDKQFDLLIAYNDQPPRGCECHSAHLPTHLLTNFVLF